MQFTASVALSEIIFLSFYCKSFFFRLQQRCLFLIYKQRNLFEKKITKPIISAVVGGQNWRPLHLPPKYYFRFISLVGYGLFLPQYSTHPQPNHGNLGQLLSPELNIIVVVQGFLKLNKLQCFNTFKICSNFYTIQCNGILLRICMFFL